MIALCIAIVVTALDQFTKELVQAHFRPGECVEVVPGLFSLTYVRNTGAAWGMLSGLSGWLAVTSVIALAAIVLCRKRFLSDGVLHRVTLGLLVAGIIGNLLDRLRLSYVVDFLDLYWRGHHFPSFNVADASISIAVFLYILSSLRKGPTPSAVRSGAAR